MQKSGLLRIFEHNFNDPLARKSWIPAPFLKRIAIEPILKTLLPSLGVFVELFVNVRIDRGGKSHLIFFVYAPGFFDGHFGDLNRFYHICLYSTFVLSGVVDLISLRVNLPRATSQLFLCFAFYSEAVLFSFHTHGRDLFNNTVTISWSYSWSPVRYLPPSAFSTREIFSSMPVSQLPSFSRVRTSFKPAGYCTGGIDWNLESRENVKFVTALSIWHLFGVSVFMVVAFVTMRAIVARMARTKRFVSLTAHENKEESECLILREDLVVVDDGEEDRAHMNSRVEESPA